MSIHRQFFVFVLIALSQAASAASNPQRHALIVGVSAYPNLGESYQLLGPANDTLLIDKLAREKFEIPAKHIVVLSEQANEALLPTRVNIEREFVRLSKNVQKGDYVWIYLAGHGSQQPASNKNDTDELDGFDEIFLPRDVGKWDAATGGVTNAISDNAIASWLAAIRAKQASVWLLIDACHSGTMLRGPGERTRSVSPIDSDGLGIPAKLMQRKAPRTRGVPKADRSPYHLAGQGGVCAIYACQPHEVTVEQTLPRAQAGSKPHGLLTYTLTQQLTRAFESSTKPITYRDLLHRISSEYIRRGRNSPRPLGEGGDLDREIFGTRIWPGKASYALLNSERVDAGSIHGLTEGSILEVRASQDETGEILGYVEVLEARMFDSDVESIDYDEHELVDEFPSGATCKSIYAGFDINKLTLAVDTQDVAGHSLTEPIRQALYQRLKTIEKEETFVQLVDAIDQADWLVRPGQDNVYLVAASEWLRSEHTMARPPLGPIASDDKLVAHLREKLNGIRRAENLLSAALDSRNEQLRGAHSPKLAITLSRQDKSTDNGRQKELSSGDEISTFYEGDEAVIKIANQGSDAADVNLFYIDSTYGISCLFPRNGRYNRLSPSRSLSFPVAFSDNTTGGEHLVVIAIQGKGERLDLSALEQPALSNVQTVAQTRGAAAETGMNSPLGKLLQKVMYPTTSNSNQPQSRGARPGDEENYQMQVLSWRVESGKRP